MDAPLPELRAVLADDDGLLQYLDALGAHHERREPGVSAWVPEEGRFTRVRRDAEALIARYPNPSTRPPLFGVPVGIKDIFRVDGFATRAGSRVPSTELVGAEARSVTALRDAGALILGKTVTTEFAFFAAGPTHNPYRAGHTPGGSSSGSAAAVGAGLTPLALGTQTIGSVGRPAAYCGVVGFKPSYDRISRAGVIPLSPSLDHVGTFTVDVAGARLAASVMIDDWRSRPVVEKPSLGIPSGPYLEAADAVGRAHFERTCASLAAAGYSLIDVPVFADFEAIRERHMRLVAMEAAAVHRTWFADHGAQYHPKTAELITTGMRDDATALEPLRAHRLALRLVLSDAMKEHGIGVWVAPGARGPAPAGIEATGDPVMSLPWSQSGLPAVTLPAGRDNDGLPLGLQLVGRFGEDEALLAMAAEIEAALPGVP